jgi:hypothetical protein
MTTTPGTATAVVRSGKTFEGMVFPDTHPLTVPDARVRRVHMFDVPALLRQHAHESLHTLSGEEWWTIGEFRYTREDYDTAVARRAMVAGNMIIEYGIEKG